MVNWTFPLLSTEGEAMVDGVVGGLTVKTALLLVTLPAPFETMT